MKGFNLALSALVALEASQRASAFCPTNFLRPQQHVMRASSVDMSSTESDVSVPYDAAARLAYDDWCKTYGKSFDAARYEVFKENYEAITVMNVAAKKAARESGDDNPSLLALNEYADYTAEEYEAAMNGEENPSSSDVLEQVAEATESQAAASSALQEAADALSEEEQVSLALCRSAINQECPSSRLRPFVSIVEQKLAEKLGLDSVEELEAAIDSMEGIAPDGGKLEGDNLAREARVRSAYLNWCKEYGKGPDESRFQQFSTNYLEMEEYAKETGKEMALNEYADCTEEEYTAMMEGQDAVEEAESAIKAAEDEMKGKEATDAKAEDKAAADAKAAKEAAAKEAEKEEEKKKAAEAAAKKREEEAAKKNAEIEAKKKAEEEEKQKMLAEKGMNLISVEKHH